jgi:hypothetical protein
VLRSDAGNTTDEGGRRVCSVRRSCLEYALSITRPAANAVVAMGASVTVSGTLTLRGLAASGVQVPFSGFTGVSGMATSSRWQS